MTSRALQPIQSGDLRQVGRLEQIVGSTDSKGMPVQAYEFVTEVRFMFTDYRPSEGLQAGQLASQVTTYITTRYFPGVNAGMRLVHVVDSSVSPPLIDYYDIQGVVRDGTARRALQLVCVKRDAAGYRAGPPSG
jgi:head-tail adaptor